MKKYFKLILGKDADNNIFKALSNSNENLGEALAQ